MLKKNLIAELTTHQESDEEVTTIIREYDTSKDIDQATGKPPLARETTQTRNKKDTGNQQLGIQQTNSHEGITVSESENNRQENEDLQSHIRQSDDSKTDSTTVRGMTRLQTFLCVLGALAIIAFFLWMRWYIKKHL